MAIFKTKGFNAANILTLIVMTVVLLFFIGRVGVPFLAPIFGENAMPDWSVLENLDVVFWFGVAFTTVVLLFVINVFMKEKITGKTVGIAILLGISIWYLSSNYDIFGWLNASIASAQTLILP